MKLMHAFARIKQTGSLKYSFQWSIVLCMLFILSGCGGGGSDPIGPVDKNTAPVANAGADQQAAPNQSVQLDGSASSDSDGTIDQYAWSQTSGTAVTLSASDILNPTFTAPNVSIGETLTFQLTVTDDDGATSSDSVSVAITSTNIAPTADAGMDQEVLEGDTVNLTASGSDTDGTVVSHAWEQVDGATTVTLANANTATPSFTAPAATETLIFRTTLTDNDGGQATDEVRIHVSAKLFADNFDGTGSTAWVKRDDVSDRAGVWQVDGNNDVLVQENLVESRLAYDESYHLGTSFYLNEAGSGSWDNYSVSVEATALANTGPVDETSQGNDIGILFRYNDANDSYYRLSMNARYSFTRLEKKVNGNFTTLAVDARGYTENQTHFLKVEVAGSLIHVYINDEAVFSVTDTDLSTGTVAFYAQNRCRFDNLVVAEPSPAPSIVTRNPLGYSVSTANSQSRLDLGATVTDMPAGGSVAFVLDNGEAVVSSSTGNPYTANFTNVAAGNHEVKAMLRDAQGVEIASDLNETVGVQGRYYITVGNSLTNGVNDDVASNNVSADGRIVGIQGYQASLNNFLTTDFGLPHIIFNEGIGGDRSSHLNDDRLDSILARHPENADAVLVMIGTNDSFFVTPDDFEANMRAIATKITSVGKSCWLARIPPVYTGTNGAPDDTRNTRIQAYNTRIQTIANQSSSDNIFLGPDFYQVFEDGFSTYYSEDGLHLNDAGYEEMARQWRGAIQN